MNTNFLVTRKVSACLERTIMSAPTKFEINLLSNLSGNALNQLQARKGESEESHNDNKLCP